MNNISTYKLHFNSDNGLWYCVINTNYQLDTPMSGVGKTKEDAILDVESRYQSMITEAEMLEQD